MKITEVIKKGDLDYLHMPITRDVRALELDATALRDDLAYEYYYAKELFRSEPQECYMNRDGSMFTNEDWHYYIKGWFARIQSLEARIAALHIDRLGPLEKELYERGLLSKPKEDPPMCSVGGDHTLFAAGCK